MAEVTKTLIVHEGNIPGALRVTHQKLWYVTEQTWSGKELVNHRILQSFKTEEEAEEFKKVREAGTRDTFLPAVRITAEERAKIESDMTTAGKSKLSDYIRLRLGLD